MDMKMVDTEDQREDRKDVDHTHSHSLNRKQRREIAKKNHVFKRKGLWGYISKAHNKRNKTDEHNKEL